jgi:hypothetical protein
LRKGLAPAIARLKITFRNRNQNIGALRHLSARL